MKLTCLLPLALFCLAGCADQKARMAGGDQSFARLPGFLPLESAAQAPASAGIARAEIERIQQEQVASNNQTQQTLAGVGLQMGKLAEKVQGFGGDLAHVDAKVTGVEKAVVGLELTVTQNNTVQAKAFENFKNHMEARFSAQGAGVAALKSELEQSTTTLTAGGNMHVQFTREFQKVLEKSYEAQVQLAQENSETTKQFLAFGGSFLGILLFMERLRNRSDREKARDDHKEISQLIAGLVSFLNKEKKS